MKLIKCNHCGRPFYDDVEACPYCGHATRLSATNYVTRPISDPKSHRQMEEVLSDEYRPEQHPVVENTVTEQPSVEPERIDMPEVAEEALPEPEPIAEMVETVEEQVVAPLSDSIQERADNIASATNHVESAAEDDILDEPIEIETDSIPRKRHLWVWIIVILLILAIAAAAYLKWDFIMDKVSSIIK